MTEKDIVIRRAEKEDRERILEIAACIFEKRDQAGLRLQLDDYLTYLDSEDSSTQWDSDSVIENIIMVSQRWYVAQKEGEKVAGFSGIERPNYEGDLNGVAWVNWTGIALEYQGNGMGSRLFQHVLQESQKNKVNMLNVKTTPKFESAIRLYEKQGFKMTGRIPGYYGAEGDLLIYTRYLNPTMEKEFERGQKYERKDRCTCSCRK